MVRIKLKGVLDGTCYFFKRGTSRHPFFVKARHYNIMASFFVLYVSQKYLTPHHRATLLAPTDSFENLTFER